MCLLKNILFLLQEIHDVLMMCTYTTLDISMRFRCQEPEHINAFPLPRTRTSLYASYFVPSTLCNSLPPEIKDCPSLSILKTRFTSRVDHNNVPKYYYCGPRLTQYYTLVFV